MTGDTAATPSLEAGAELKRTPDRLEAHTEASRFSPHARRSAPRFALWRHDLRETRETWFRLVDPDGQDLTPEGS